MEKKRDGEGGKETEKVQVREGERKEEGERNREREGGSERERGFWCLHYCLHHFSTCMTCLV